MPGLEAQRPEGASDPGAVVECEGLTKRFGDVPAVDGVDLAVAPGEILALLGPSGCGKTTFLRLLAGFERPDAGRIRLAGRDVGGPGVFVPPERRKVGVVFQDYALFPHLSVGANIAYGVRERAVRPARVEEILDLVGLRGAAQRMPHELSGGQQQRVALGRALAPGPLIVLLDEPFSNLDAGLRVRLRGEVRAILRAAGATAVFVTHDQEEALSLADRVAVMRAGRLLQVGTPADIYEHPGDPFVAAFVGEADVVWGDSDGRVVTTELGVLVPGEPVPEGRALVVVRGESVRVRLDGSGRAVVRSITFYGHDQVIEVDLPDGTRIRARTIPTRHFEPGDRVKLFVKGDVVAFPASSAAPT